jgi:hypothetical protein
MPPRKGKKQWLEARDGLRAIAVFAKGAHMGFWGSLFGGSNPTLSSDIKDFGAIGKFATNLGEQNLNKASNFWSSILSGNQSKISQTLAPEVNAMQQQGQQQKEQLGQFGTRSGGTASAAANIGAQTRGNISNMVASLLGSSASNLGSLGSSTLGQGMQALGQQANLSQVQMQNWASSILGRGITGGIGTITGGGVGSLFG